MEIYIICSKEMKIVFEETAKSKGFVIKLDSNIVFVEKGMEDEVRTKTFISFDPNDLKSFIVFLDELKENIGSDIQNMIAVKDNENLKLFPYEEVQYFEADNNDVFCIVKNNKSYFKVKDKLYQLEEKLNSKIFIRVSKSSIVNIMSINEILPLFGGKLLLKFKDTTKTVEVTRSYLKRFKAHLGI